MAACVLGILLGSYIHYDYAMWNRLGRQAFMNYQILRFDRYMLLPQPIFRTMTVTMVLAMGVAVFYELVVLLFSTILKRKSQGSANQ